jgi:hypothetical protein
MQRQAVQRGAQLAPAAHLLAWPGRGWPPWREPRPDGRRLRTGAMGWPWALLAPGLSCALLRASCDISS